MWRISMLIVGCIVLAGCMNITTRVQEDPSVQEVLVGSDCLPIILGLAYGTVDVTTASRNAQPSMGQGRASYCDPAVGMHRDGGWHPCPGAGSGQASGPIVKVRRVEVWDFMLWAFGARCVEVAGEPAPQTTSP